MLSVRVDEPVALRHLAADHQTAHLSHQRVSEAAQVGAGAVQRIELPQRGGAILLSARAEQRHHGAPVNQPQTSGCGGSVDMIAGVSDHLLKQAQRVAHPPFSRHRNDPQRLTLNRQLLAPADVLELLHDPPRRDPLKVVPLTPRLDGIEHFMWLGGRKDKMDGRRRLFEKLEQRVERLVGEHMHFIDDEDSAAQGRSSMRSLLQLAHVVDAVVACAVDLLDIQRMPPCDRHAGCALTTGVCLWPDLAVERHGQDACRAGLTHPSRAAK